MNMAAQQCGICGWDAIGGPGCQVTSLAPKRIDNLRVTTADRGTLHSTVQPLLSHREGMKIFVKTLRAKGKQIVLEVEPGDTIGAVKAKIQERLENRVLSGNQRLIFNRQPDLQDHVSLKEYGIYDGAAVMLVELVGYQFYIMDDTDGMIHTVYVEHNTFQVMTVGELKIQCQIQLCCPADHQLLVFRGRQLENDKTLVSCRIAQGSTIHLVPLSIKGGRSYHVYIDAPEETIVIHTCECIRIQDLKRRINERLRIPLSEQRLTTKSGQELKDEKSLSEYRIKLRSTLILYRIPGTQSSDAGGKYDGQCQICGKMMEDGDPEAFSLESRPELRRLQKITSIEGRDVEVADRVSHHWEKLAQVLRLERSATKQVKRKEKTHQAACIAVLQLWLSGKGRRPVSWETMMNGLKEIGQRDLCEDLMLVRREGIRLDDGRIVIYF